MSPADIKADVDRLLTWIYDLTRGELGTEVDLTAFFDTEADWTEAHWLAVKDYIETQGWGVAIELSPLALEQDPNAAPVDAFDENTPTDAHDPEHQRVLPRGLALTEDGIGHVELTGAGER